MITFKNLTIKNFMSVGNITQGISFDNDLTLVLGENLDLGANGSRNGTGKTTIVNALSYALYGNALTKIKLGNLINKTNEKAMLVSVEFNKNKIDYKIERGRKPNILKLFIGDQVIDDSALGDNRETQKMIDDILGLSHDMFKHIVALNTHTEPFLNMKVSDQRDIIEELLGITILSEKASVLKDLIKEMKDSIKHENFKITAIKESNKRIEAQISNLENKHKEWNASQLNDVSELYTKIEKLEKCNIDVELEISNQKKFEIYNTKVTNVEVLTQTISTLESKQELWDATLLVELNTIADAIEELNDLDIKTEIQNHKDLEEYNTQETKKSETHRLIISTKQDIKRVGAEIETLHEVIKALKSKVCHTCGNELHDDKQSEILISKETSLSTSENEITVLIDTETKLKHQLDGYTTTVKPLVFYKSLEEALNHKHSLETLNLQMETRAKDDNPYTEQIESIRTDALQEIDYSTINDDTLTMEHQQFLLKLLTDKDSFVRKQIISQNLSFLNNKLSHYIDIIGLRHLIEFKDDLSVEITDLGKDYDFDNLSRGEKNRVILSLSWAFRDVWESLYSPINLLFVDEVIDSGMDDAGVENSLVILKTMAREQNKSVWLISHKNELISRVNSVLNVVKENGFTSFSKDS